MNGWWFQATPLKKIRVRQLGVSFYIYGKINMFQTTNQSSIFNKQWMFQKTIYFGVPLKEMNLSMRKELNAEAPHIFGSHTTMIGLCLRNGDLTTI